MPTRRFYRTLAKDRQPFGGYDWTGKLQFGGLINARCFDLPSGRLLSLKGPVIFYGREGGGFWGGVIRNFSSLKGGASQKLKAEEVFCR